MTEENKSTMLIEDLLRELSEYGLVIIVKKYGKYSIELKPYDYSPSIIVTDKSPILAVLLLYRTVHNI